MHQNIMRLYCSRIKKKDSQGILGDGHPLQSRAAVDALRGSLKFSGIDSLEGKNKVMDSSHEIENQLIPKKYIQNTKHISRGTKSMKALSKTSAMENGLSQIAYAVRVINTVKECELRLRCISSYPESEMKT